MVVIAVSLLPAAIAFLRSRSNRSARSAHSDRSSF